MLEISHKSSKTNCKFCQKKLGYFLYNGKRPYKAFYFSNKPKMIFDKTYFRIVCIDCFFEKFDRLPKKPNVVNPSTGMSSVETWNRDKNKNNFLISQGFDVITIWEKDYNDDPENIINNLTSEIIRRYNEIP